jgi:hypothetical protein
MQAVQLLAQFNPTDPGVIQPCLLRFGQPAPIQPARFNPANLLRSSQPFYLFGPVRDSR